jgi:CRP-like cAMP-binding protein
MLDIKKALNANILFKNFSNQEINNFLISSHYRILSYEVGQIIAIEGDPLPEIGLVLEGTLEVQKNYPSGKTLVIDQLTTGDVFGEVVVFSSKNIFPSSIFSITASKIMFVKKNNLVKICFQNENFLINLLQLLSEKILILNNRLHFLSSGTIRQKICFYLIERYQNQKSLHISTSISREKMAEQFGTTRPSLSRELSYMQRDGLIDIHKNFISIKDLKLLEENLSCLSPCQVYESFPDNQLYILII